MSIDFFETARDICTPPPPGVLAAAEALEAFESLRDAIDMEASA